MHTPTQTQPGTQPGTQTETDIQPVSQLPGQRRLPTLSSSQVVETFLSYFRERGHERITGTSLIPPDGDPVLFTTSGMHPLTPYLEGRPHPGGRRLVNLQRCLRTTDLDEVGDATHLTVFGMLGSWSLGDYDGPRSLRWGYDLLVDGFGIDPRLLHSTVFGGDDQVPEDTSSRQVWETVGVPVELIEDDNWWSNGPSGPCGPDSEIFVWTGEGPPTGTPTTDERWVEVWNHVMMRYRRLDGGRLVDLEQRNVDTGMGLERLLMVLQSKPSVYETDLFTGWTTTVTDLWNPTGTVTAMGEEDLRLVCDHLRSSIVVAGDGIRPSNTRRGYVLRRLLRRTWTTLWVHDSSRTLRDVPTDLVSSTLDQFELPNRPGDWYEMVGQEEDRFRGLLDRGRRLVDKRTGTGPLTPDDVRFLRETHGVPEELLDSPLLGAGDLRTQPRQPVRATGRRLPGGRY